MIFRNYLLSRLPDGDAAILGPLLTEVSLPSGKILQEPDEPVETIYFPSSAVVSVVVVMADGRLVECNTIGHESAVGLLPALGRSLSTNRVFVQLPGAALKMPAAPLRLAVGTSPLLRELIMRHIHGNIAMSEQSVACNALHDVSARLCRWLLICQDRTGSDVLQLTQDYLSVMLGVQRTTVSTAARTLLDAGVIRYRRGVIEILDRPGMERRSCECYEAVRGIQERVALGSSEDAAA